MEDAYSFSSNCIFRASILGLILVVLTVGFSALAVSAETLSGCSKINSSGTYNLDSSINISDNETCMNITSSDVILDGNDNYINGKNTSGENGLVRIYNESKRLENTTIRGLTIFNSDYDNSSAAIVAENSKNLILKNINATSHSVGINLGSFSSVNSSKIQNTVIQDIGYMGVLSGGNSNNFTNLSIGADSGVYTQSGIQHLSNTVINTDNIGVYSNSGRWVLDSVNVTSTGGPELESRKSSYNVDSNEVGINGTNVRLNSMKTSFDIGATSVNASAKNLDYSSNLNSLNRFFEIRQRENFGSYVQLNVSYDDSEASGLDEVDLKIYNKTGSNFNPLNSGFEGVDTSENYVYANISQQDMSDSYTAFGIFDSKYNNTKIGGTAIDYIGQNVKIHTVSDSFNPSSPFGKENVSSYINVTNTSKTSSWIYMNLSYSDSNVAEKHESDLRIWHYYGEGWSKVSGTNDVNENKNYVYANASSFSAFAVFSDSAPEISVNPSSHDFGELETGNRSKKVFNITNNGIIDLNITNISIKGDDSNQFNITSNKNGTISSGGVNVSNYSEYLLEVKFNPNSTGEKDAYLNIVSNDPDDDDIEADLDGDGISDSNSSKNNNPGAAGGGASSNKSSMNHIWFDVDANTSKTVDVDADKQEKIGVRNVTVSLTETKDKMEINIEERNGRPDEVDEPSGQDYNYMNISSSASQSEIKNATVEFEVNQSWVDNNNVKLGSITLQRFNDGSWEGLNTQNIGKENSDYIFEAESPGFSIFAVTGEKEESQEQQNDSNNNDNSNASENINSTEGNQSINQSSSSSDDPSLNSTSLIILLAAVFILLCLAIDIYILRENIVEFFEGR